MTIQSDSYDHDTIAAAESLSSEEAQAAFKVALNEIINSMDSIQSDFQAIKQGISGLKDAEDASKTWDGLAKKYSDIQWDLKDNSSKLATYASQFGATHLVMVAGGFGSIPPDSVVAALSAFRLQSKTLGEATRTGVDEFESLKKDLLKFKDVFKALSAVAAGRQQEKANALQAQVESAQKEMEEISQRMDELLLRKLAKLVERLQWLKDIPYSGKLKMLLNMIVDFFDQDQIQKLDSEYKVAKQKRDKAREDLKNLGKTLNPVDQLMIMVNNMVDNRLTDAIDGSKVFRQIWEGIDKDAEDLVKHLRKELEETPLPLAVYQKKKQSVYSGITEALKWFAIGIPM